MKITVVGAGYVGLSLATLISTKHEVVAVDIVPQKIKQINNRVPPLKDNEIEHFFSNRKLSLTATSDMSMCKESDFIIIATPTNYDCTTCIFDTSSIESVIEKIDKYCADSTFVIKSTVPIGYTKHIYNKYKAKNILFSPEFLREGHALYDNLHPSRIVVGIPCQDSELRDKGLIFSKLLNDCSEEEYVDILITGSTEAESIKLFSNSYLAMRVAFFNELDSFSEKNGLNSGDIINGVCMDPRIGNYYNNPSFGYGGYCLPKDTKQLLSNYHDVPNEIISAIVNSNETRKNFITGRIDSFLREVGGSVVGVYRLIMKSNSDNFRESSVVDVIEKLESMGYKIIIYEPMLDSKRKYDRWEVISDLNKFKSASDIIIANRHSSELKDSMNKVYCRDVFFRD